MRVILRVRELIRASPSMDWDRETRAEIDRIFASLLAEVCARMHAEQVAMLERYKREAEKGDATLESLFPYPTLRRFYSHWAEKDGLAATDGVYSLGISWLRLARIHYEWSKADPDAALEWALSASVAERFPGDLLEIRSRSFYRAADKDFESAMGKLAGLDGEFKQHILPFLAADEGMDESKVSRLLGMAEGVPKPEETLQGILGKFASENPAEALALVERMEGSPELRAERERHCFNQAPAEFFPRWLEAHGADKGGEKAGEVVKIFISKHPSEAIEWLNGLDDGARRDHLQAGRIDDLVESLSEAADPFGGKVGSAEGISDPALRREVYRGLYRMQLERDPGEAEAWRMEVPEEDRPEK
ncbi:hypothetical protein OJ996_24180 [Luteolibacter sp. GHJ8]|uniref:DUF4034 domain-containing protein n=1 Tax=Luteolibacter rhizosphaerae TaxID=2989719 RepID=A0ABT3GA30_9BACT|nr:hypothetical protein [Luteolibacter rhizosphaerae]MCW1916707.1 hypothetical protein [Luteolibacter rhizosphaerae]